MAQPIPLANQKHMADILMSQGWTCTPPIRYSARMRNKVDAPITKEALIQNQESFQSQEWLLGEIKTLINRQTRILRHLIADHHPETEVEDEPTEMTLTQLKLIDEHRIERLVEYARDGRPGELDVKPYSRRHDVLLTLREQGSLQLKGVREFIGASASSRLSELVKAELVEKDGNGFYSLTTFGRNKLAIIDREVTGNGN